MDGPDPSEVPNAAERLFAEYLAGLDEHDPGAVDELCGAHPEHSDELRRLWEGWDAVRRGLLGDVTRQLSVRFGAHVVPDIQLDPAAEEADEQRPRQMLERLADRRESLGRYRIVCKLAEGGQGEIFKVFDTDLRRHLAMKVIRGRKRSSRPGEGSPPSVDSSALGRFLEEAQVTGQLDHPAIVPVHELGVDSNDRVYFTMKLVKGQSLHEVLTAIRDGSESWSHTRMLTVLLRVCEAVAFAHDKGVLHRDLKPANIMVGEFGEVYVMDWGLARILDRRDDPRRDIESELRESSPRFSQLGVAIGTPVYMSPEQARGKHGEVGTATDIYALGAMLYHLLAGQSPYVAPHERPSPEAVVERVRSGPPRPLAEIAPGVPAELVAVCERAMCRAPEHRYSSVSRLAGDLRAWLEGRVVGAYEQGAVAELRKWVGRNKAAAAAVLAVVLGLVAGAVAVNRTLEADKLQQLTAQAQAARDLAEEARDEADRQRALADVAREEADRQRQLAVRATGQARAAELMTSALLARQQGDWQAILDDVARTRDIGQADQVTLGLLQARAHLARREWAPADAALDAMPILSPRLELSVRHLEGALVADPVHIFARSDLLAVTLLAGQLPKASVLADMYARLYPSETTPWVVRAFLATLRGDEPTETALANLQRMDPVLAEQIELAVLALEQATQLVKRTLQGFTRSTSANSAAISASLLGISGRLDELGRERIRPFFGYATLDSTWLERSWGKLPRLLQLSATTGAAAAAEILEAAEAGGNAFLYLLSGLAALMGDRSDAEQMLVARNTLAKVAQSDFHVEEMVPASRHLQLAAETALVRVTPIARRETYRGMLVDSLRWFAQRDDLSPLQLDLYSDVALAVGAYELGRRLAVRWTDQQPETPMAHYRLAEAESQLGAIVATLRANDRFLELAPEHPKGGQLREWCVEQIGDVATELGVGGE